jgi:hypothetical protein
MKIGIDVDALYNEYPRLRLVLPALNKETDDDKICTEHFRKNRILVVLNEVDSFVFYQTV